MNFLKYLNPMHYVKYLLKPGQFNSFARTILKALGGYLTALGFSSQTVSSFEEAALPIIAGLLSLAAGSIASFLSEKEKK